MIQKLSRPGAGFRGILNYALAAKKQPELIGGTMAGETARELAAEFGHGRSLNPAVHKPVFACSLTAAPADRLSESDWRRFAETYLERLGYGDCQRVLIRHHDTDNDHIHIIAYRIDSRGKRVADFQEIKRGEAIVRDLEKEYRLTRVAPSREASRAAPAREELAKFARTGDVAVKARLQEHVDVAARGRPSLVEFAERLQTQGVEVHAHVASTGRLSGLSFALDGVSCKGSDLGRGYSWQGLAERTGVHYEPARDLARLRALGAVAARERPAAVERGAVLAVTGAAHAARESSAPARPPAAPTSPASWPARQADARARSSPATGAAARDLGERLRDAIDRAAQGQPRLPELVERLAVAGVRVRANLASTGRLSGLSFEVEGVTWKGSELGRDYAWRALAARHGIRFEAERDRSRLEAQGAAARRDRSAEVAPAEQAPRAPVYRSAAVLASRLEIEARAKVLTQRQVEIADVAHRAENLVADHAHKERFAVVDPLVLHCGLRATYKVPEAAGRALDALLRQEGTLRAAETLERSPECFGSLRGVGLGGLHNAARRKALAGAAALGRELREVAARQAQLAAAAPAVAAAAVEARSARERVYRLSDELGRLPPARRLEADMVRAAGVLGARLTSRLVPAATAEKLLRRAVRATLDLLRGRDDDRSLGR
jgi:hypothetical protein